MGITSMGVALLKGKGSMTTLRKEIYLRCLKKKKQNWWLGILTLWWIYGMSSLALHVGLMTSHLAYTPHSNGMMWLEWEERLLKDYVTTLDLTNKGTIQVGGNLFQLTLHKHMSWYGLHWDSKASNDSPIALEQLMRAMLLLEHPLTLFIVTNLRSRMKTFSMFLPGTRECNCYSTSINIGVSSIVHNNYHLECSKLYDKMEAGTMPRLNFDGLTLLANL